MTSAVVVDFGMGNVGSVVNMGQAAGGRLRVSDSAREISQADKLILPGVGIFDEGMNSLRERGLVEALGKAVLDRGTPILGICLGMQLFSRGSDEGDRAGLGWLPADTLRFNFSPGQPFRVPHMGWNDIAVARPDPLLQSMAGQARFYFVHSYYLRCDDVQDVVAWTTYGIPFASVVRHRNIWGCQFHPEKSHKFGLSIMRNFLAVG
jgi:glutamine amidotransferase